MVESTFLISNQTEGLRDGQGTATKQFLPTRKTEGSMWSIGLLFISQADRERLNNTSYHCPPIWSLNETNNVALCLSSVCSACQEKKIILKDVLHLTFL